MGLIGNILGIGGAARDVAEVFVENRTKKAEQEHEENIATLDQLAKEFARPRGGWFDETVDGMNRLPRPALALSTIGLFGYAMADPIGFAARMQGLQLVPDPLWWLMGGVVSFYFGARELHYLRGNDVPMQRVREVADSIRELQGLRPQPEPADDDPEAPPVVADTIGNTPSDAFTRPATRTTSTGPSGNAALDEWRALQRG